MPVSSLYVSSILFCSDILCSILSIISAIACLQFSEFPKSASILFKSYFLFACFSVLLFSFSAVSHIGTHVTRREKVIKAWSGGLLLPFIKPSKLCLWIRSRALSILNWEHLCSVLCWTSA